MNASVNFFFRPAEHLRNESHMFFGGPVRKQCRLLQYISGPAPQLDCRYFPGVDSIDRDLACGGGDKTVDDTQQGAFTTAPGSDDSEGFSFIDRERNLMKCLL